jgi:hypothetical protein
LPFISFKTADDKRKGGIFVNNNKEFINTFKFFYNMNFNDLKNIGSEGYDYYINNNTYTIYKDKINNMLNTLYE